MENTVYQYDFTCQTCDVSYPEPQQQIVHFKTDWHRYNLKRRVADLPPIKAEAFLTRSDNQINTELQSGNQREYCNVCKKAFGTVNAFNNHMKSKRHKENKRCHTGRKSNARDYTLLRDETMHAVSEADSEEWENVVNPMDNNDCIFCLQHSESFLENLEHMTIEHSFFIPDIEFCTDVQGLLTYLGAKISADFMCLWCNEKGKTFQSAEAARSHMIDKGHCKMIHSGAALAEYVDFYDYSRSYPDAADNPNPDEEVALPELDGSDYQLVLPSGITVGHRSLMRYYKQSNNPNRSVVVRKENKHLHKVLASYRVLGWSETDQKTAAKTARDVHVLKRMQSKYMMKLGVKGNKLQTHFRQQINY